MAALHTPRALKGQRFFTVESGEVRKFEEQTCNDLVGECAIVEMLRQVFDIIRLRQSKLLQ